MKKQERKKEKKGIKLKRGLKWSGYVQNPNLMPFGRLVKNISEVIL